MTQNTRESIEEIEQEYPNLDRPLAEMADDRVLADLDEDELIELSERAERAEREARALRYMAAAQLSRRKAYARNPVADTAAELACAHRISQRAAESLVAEARILVRLFPEALKALAAGRIQVTQARALIDTTGALDDDAARAVQDHVLPLMAEQNPAATRKALARAILKVDPEGAQRRHEAARKDRRVEHYPEAEGMSTVSATLPAEQAVHAMNVLTEHARAGKQQNPDDERTLDQARADSLYQLVTGNTQHCPPALVHVTVPLDTLIGAHEEPGNLEGYGPITAQTARMLAAGQDAMWRRLLTAPDSGLVVKTDPHTYRPTAEVRRHVSARDGHCSFPGCAMPASKTDLDHVVAFDHRRPERGGLTVPENLRALCRNAGELGVWVGCQGWVGGVCGSRMNETSDIPGGLPGLPVNQRSRCLPSLPRACWRAPSRRRAGCSRRVIWAS